MYDLNFHAANMYIVVLLWAFFSECVCVCVRCVCVWGGGDVLQQLQHIC